MNISLPPSVSTFLAAARNLLDILPDGVTLIIPSGQVAYANASAARLLNIPLTDLEGRHAEVIDEAGWADVTRVFEDGVPQIGARTVIRNKLYIASRLPVRIEGTVAAVVSFFQGVFSYDKVALELDSYKQMADLLEAIMESSYDGLWITDRHGNVVKLNKAAERITGCVAEEVIGRNVADLVAEKYFSNSVSLEVLKLKTTVTMVQTTKANKKILATGSPIFNPKGEIDVIIINDRDITELDRMRTELEESKALVDLYRYELSGLKLREKEASHFISRSKVMETVYEKAMRVARFDSTVLLTGESGVGKGMLAKLIHGRSDRTAGPFIRVDCAAIVETLFESELFGYERGAFTGAGPKGKVGLVEMADGGTLFLDEIAEVPLSQQVKLLRFLDEKKLVRVGGSEVRQVDTRVIAATNRDLAEQVRNGMFRKDLFYRLNVVPLHIPPLRERTQDIFDLITFLMKEIGEKHQLHKRIDRDALEYLLHYSYPGNVRELQNIVESMLVMGSSDTVVPGDLPAEVTVSFDPAVRGSGEPQPLPEIVEQVEVEHIIEAMRKYGSQREAARRLGVNQSTVSRKLRKYRVALPDAPV